MVVDIRNPDSPNQEMQRTRKNSPLIFSIVLTRPMMRIVFCVIGVIVAALPIFRVTRGFASWNSIWLACGVLVVITLGGILLLLLIVVGVRNYRGEWPTIFGTIFALLGIAGFISEIDNFIEKSYEDAALGIGLAAFFLTSGVLLLFSGHKLHKYSSQSDLIPEIQNNNEENMVQQTDTADSQTRG